MFSKHLIQSVRDDTPASQNKIHLNNAGAALSPACVVDAVSEHLALEQILGGYEAANFAENKIANFYTALGKLVNCTSDEIACMENATVAWTTALHAIPFREGDTIITTRSEYASNYLGLLHLAKRKGLKLITLPLQTEGANKGLVAVEQIRTTLKTLIQNGEKPRLLAITHIASQRGDVQPAVEIGALAAEFGLYYLLDACQSAGQIDLDVEALQCDFLCGTGRKYLRGPRGTGFLYVNKERIADLKPECIDLHSASWVSETEYNLADNATRFENFEGFVAGKIGLAVAVDYALNLGLENIQKRISHLAHFLHRKPVFDTAGSPYRLLEQSSRLSGIVTFSTFRQDAGTLKKRLQDENINVSVARAQNAQMDLTPEGHGDVCRASLHYYNTEEELDRFAEVLEAL